jgi:hypothetical protein
MTEPVSDIKIGLRIWKYLGIAKKTWDQIASAPKQIAELQKRVAELEDRLKRCPGEGCPHCGALEWRIEKSDETHVWTRHYGAREYHYLCGACGHKDVRTVYPSNMPRTK